MNNKALEWICYGWIGIAILIHFVLFYIKAPFGRHKSTTWGPSMNNKWGWCIMELPSLLIMTYFLFYGAHSLKGYTWILFACWIIHYTHRSIIYPLRIKTTDKKIPIAIVCSAIIFNLVNAGLNGYQLGQVPPRSDEIVDMRLSAGAAIFLAGLFINLRSDSILIGLRGKGEKGYKIPHGFLFQYISTPNLFGEILEWAGFAMMAWNLPAFTFLIWTYANLVPRAKNHHEWYLQHFPDYPKDRKIIFPFIY